MIAREVVRDLWGPVDSGRVFAELTIVSGLAPIVAPLLGGQLLRVMPWQGLFVVLAGIGALLLVGATLLPESLPVERRRSDGLRQTLAVGADLVRSRRLRLSDFTRVAGLREQAQRDCPVPGDLPATAGVALGRRS